MTPDDPLAIVGDPPLGLWRPAADEVHVSCTFTWDIPEAKRLAAAWGTYYDTVRLGGPAFGSKANGFQSGFYVRQGVTFTTRGCNNQCPWCLVPEREGRLVEISDFAPGHIVQDNNLLQASRPHIERVVAMLKTQRAAVFSGGLEAARVTDWFAEELRGLTISEVFLAADTSGALRPLERALKRLSFLPRRKLRVYTMIGYGEEAPEEAEARMEAVWDLGGLPFAQLHQPPGRWIEYSSEWRALRRTWSRPAAMFALHAGSADLGRKNNEEK
jgi:hypothetical protein